MRKYVLLSVAILALCAWMAAESIPSTKTAAQMKYIDAAYDTWTEILSVQIKTGTPKDLIISVTAETSLTTTVKLKGDVGSSARAAIEIQVTVDGNAIEIAGGGNFIVFNDRLLQLTGDLKHADGINPDHWIEIFMATKSANGFNWFTEDVGSGIHTVRVYARKFIAVDGVASATALVGNASVVVDEVNLK